MMIKKLACWWLNHKFDKERYRKELKDYYDLKTFLSLPKESLEDYFNNPPKAFCKRCQQTI